jgi:O-antigen/teichoic acid export membrane protein
VLIRNSALYAAGRALPGLVGMATTALLTRMLAPADYGQFGLALVVATLGSTLVFDWLGLAFLRLGLDAGADAAIGRLFSLLVLLTAAIGSASWAAGLLGHAAASGLLLMCCTAAFELAARRPVNAGQPGRFLLMNATRTVVSLLGATGAAALTRDPILTAYGFALGPAVGACLAGTAPPGRQYDGAALVRVLRFGLPLAASMALAGAANSGTRALLEALDGPEALGLYTAAFLLVQNTLSVVAAGIASAGYPASVRLVETGQREAAAGQLAANWSLLLAVLAPMAAGMALTGSAIATLLVGPRYVDGVARLIPWLAGAGLLAGLRSQGLDHVFQLAGASARLTLVTGVMAVAALGLTACLAPGAGAVGAAQASCGAALVGFVIALLWGRLTWRVPLPIDAAARIMAACGAMALIVTVVPGGLAAHVAAGVVSYATIAFALGLFGLRRRRAAPAFHAELPSAG